MPILLGTDVKDADGKQIIKGSIVRIQKGSSWANFDGLVVAPHYEYEDGRPEDKAHTVAIFLAREVDAGYFVKPRHQVGEWDAEYMRRFAVDGETEFLFAEDVWTKCPRIIFCRPEDLIVIESWSVNALVERLFKNRYHTCPTVVVPKGYNLEDFLCHLEGCQNPATKVAFGNVHGHVSAVLTCANCFKEINGISPDELPKMKAQMLFLDGSTYEKPV